MMQQKIGSENECADGNSSNGQLLRDIEEISKALYLQTAPQEGLVSRPAGRSKSVEKPQLSELNSTLNPRNVSSIVSFKDKKSSSGWNWKKPLKALSHIGYQKFNVCFFLHVHSIEGLPLSCNDVNLFVQLKRKDEVLQTRPSTVVKGTAEFNETLLHKCCVYGSRSGPHNSAKYEAKLFLIYASVVGAPGIDMGKHWIDLARLLPATLEELEGQKSTGKWTTSFKLEGMAKNATLNVSFGFSLVKDNLSESRRNMIVSELVNLVDERSCMLGQITSSRLANSNGMLRRVGSVPSDVDCRSPRASQPVDSKIYDEVSSNLGLELSNSIKFLYQKLNEVNIHSSEKLRPLSEDVKAHKLKLSPEFELDKDNSGHGNYSSEFTIIDQGVEMLEKEDLELEGRDIHPVDDIGIETIDVDEIFKDDDTELDEKNNFLSEDRVSDNYAGLVLVDDCEFEDSTCRKGSCIEEELELALNNFLISESADLEYPLSMCEFVEQEIYMETKSNYKADKVIERSRSLDELTESVASDFLNMLGAERSPFRLSSDSDLDSPRGRLLREFEEEAISSGNYIIEYNAENKDKEFNCVDPGGSDCGDLSWDFNFSTVEDHGKTSQLLTRRRKAKVLEDLETEALMKEWGLNEEAFQNTPRHCSDGFGSPVELLPEEPVELPSLGDGLGPFIQIKDGGFVRSMNPSLFRNFKNIGSLVMQVSRPVVLPAELGADIIEILQHLASVGIERLSSHLNKLMPMEDINGKTLQQIAHNAAIPVRKIPLCCESLFDQDTILDAEMEPDYVTIEHLLPLAMNAIETMSIEGLKIQSGMSEEEAPSSVGPKPIVKMLAFEGKRANLGWFLSSEGAAELRALDAEESGCDTDRLLDLSLTLQDWLRLDAGIIDDEDQVSEHAVYILAAHHAKCMGFKLKASGRRHGMLGNNLTLAFMVLLRDPFRNYEPVGASMIALVQLERSFFHFKRTLFNTPLEGSSNECIQNEDTYDDRSSEQCTIGFKITEVHLSGLNTEPGKTQLWGTKTQQQYGTRWLLARGVSKAFKHPFSKSTVVVASRPQSRRRIRNKDVLWSISSHNNDTKRNWKDSMGLVQYMRNPDVMFAE